jgi:hypothetical protein
MLEIHAGSSSSHHDWNAERWQVDGVGVAIQYGHRVGSALPRLIDPVILADEQDHWSSTGGPRPFPSRGGRLISGDVHERIDHDSVIAGQHTETDEPGRP